MQKLVYLTGLQTRCVQGSAATLISSSQCRIRAKFCRSHLSRLISKHTRDRFSKRSCTRLLVVSSSPQPYVCRAL